MAYIDLFDPPVNCKCSVNWITEIINITVNYVGNHEGNMIGNLRNHSSILPNKNFGKLIRLSLKEFVICLVLLPFN